MSRRHAVVAVIASLAVAQAQDFVAPDTPLGGPLASFVVGDTNGDGLADAFVEGLGGGRVTLGLPGGGFGPALAAWTGELPPPTARGRLLADLTGDGRDDLVLTVEGAFELYVAPALPDGRFATPVVTSLPSAVGGIDAADVDGDGLVDLWYGEIIGSRARRLTSLGDGRLVASGTVAVPKRPTELALGDVTGDGLPDVVTLSLGENFVDTIPAVAAGLPGGGVASAVPLVEPSARVHELRVADVTGDGVDDVALLTIDTIFTPPGTPLGFVHVGGPTIAVDAPVDLPEGGADTWRVADVDADGLGDLVLLEAAVSRVVVRRQLEPFAFDDGLGVGIGPFAAPELAALDADADGAVDVISASTRGTIRLGVGRGDGTFAPGVATPLDAFASLARVGDLDGDGRPELVTIASTVDGARVAIHSGRPGPWFGEPVVRTISAPVERFELLDAERDGDLDIVAWFGIASPTRGIATLLNQDGVVDAAIEQTFPGVTASAVALGDVTGDGLFDVTVFPSAFSGGPVLRFEGDAIGFVDPAPVIVGTAPIRVVDAVVGEVDGLSPPDVIAVAPFADGAPAVLTVTPSGVSAAGAPVDVDPRVLGAGDWNGDGLTDLVVGRQGPGFEVRVNDGTGTFIVTSFVPDTLSVDGFDARDLDGDGDVDLAVAERGLPNDGDLGRVSTWLNDGAADFAPGGVTVLEQIGGGVALADVDGDALLDAVVSSGLEVVVLPSVDATWTPLGASLAGPAGFSRLDGDGPLVAGGEVTLTARRAAPSAPSTLVVGFAELAAPFAGGVLVPNPDVLVTGLVTDGVGGLELSAVFPPGVPAGFELFAQLWQPALGGFSATTAVRGITR